MPKLPPHLFTLSAIARDLGVCQSDLHRHVVVGHIPRPSVPYLSRLYYSMEDADLIRRFWAERVPLGCARFTSAEIEVMREMWNGGMRQVDIAAHYGITQADVSRYLRGRTPPGRRGGVTARAYWRRHPRPASARCPERGLKGVLSSPLLPPSSAHLIPI